MWYSDAEINFVSSFEEYYGDVDGFVPHFGGDCALSNLAALLPPRQLAARQISQALHLLPCNSTKINLFTRSTLEQKTSTKAVIVRRLSMILIVNVSQPFLRAKPKPNIVVFCFVDGEWVLSFLVGEYLALVDEVIPFAIFPYASDSCRCFCMVRQCEVDFVSIIGVMIDILKYFHLLGVPIEHFFEILHNWNQRNQRK
jgi:hypothetical protein